MIYLGIDNGISGGLVAISDVAGLPPIAMLTMPPMAARRATEIDILAVDRWVRALAAGNSGLTVVIEEPGGSQSSKAARSMEGSFQALRAMCQLRNLRWHRITPQSWQRVMLPGCKAGETKARALAAARALWPGEKWLATERSTKPHEGLIDGALIAEHARRQKL